MDNGNKEAKKSDQTPDQCVWSKEAPNTMQGNVDDDKIIQEGNF